MQHLRQRVEPGLGVPAPRKKSPARAAELAHQCGVRYPTATARAHAAVAALLERLPAALVRLQELAEAGAPLAPAGTWLK